MKQSNSFQWKVKDTEDTEEEKPVLRESKPKREKQKLGTLRSRVHVKVRGFAPSEATVTECLGIPRSSRRELANSTFPTGCEMVQRKLAGIPACVIGIRRRVVALSNYSIPCFSRHFSPRERHAADPTPFRPALSTLPGIHSTAR
jgi:hypothetical protein